jgi:hypothetical protein
MMRFFDSHLLNYWINFYDKIIKYIFQYDVFINLPLTITIRWIKLTSVWPRTPLG